MIALPDNQIFVERMDDFPVCRPLPFAGITTMLPLRTRDFTVLKIFASQR